MKRNLINIFFVAASILIQTATSAANECGTLPLGAIGAMRLRPSPVGYKVHIEFPGNKNECVPETKDIPYYQRSTPIKTSADFYIYDAKGLLGRISSKSSAIQFVCENDGGVHYRASLKIELKQLPFSRTLKPTKDFAAIVSHGKPQRDLPLLKTGAKDPSSKIVVRTAFGLPGGFRAALEKSNGESGEAAFRLFVGSKRDVIGCEGP